MKPALLAVVSCAAIFARQTSGPLNDSRIMGLAQAGVSQAELIRMVGAAQQVDFDLRPVATGALAKAGVSEDVIRAMAARESGSGVPGGNSSPATSSPIGTPDASSVS